MSPDQTIGEVEAARQLSGLLDRLPVLVSFWDRDQRCAYANRAYREWFGLNSKQIRGIHMRKVLGEARYQEILPNVERALEGEEQSLERNVVDSRGRTRRSAGRYVPYGRGGSVEGFFVVVEDYTAESEMRQQLDTAQTLARIGSYVYYPVTGEVAWSDEMFRLIEADPERDVPSLRLWESRIHPEDRESAVATLDDCFTNGRSFALHTRLLLPSGQIRQVKCLGEPGYDDAGTFNRMSGTVQDETDIRQVAEELRRSNDRLEGANRLLSDTIATLSHDVRQPVQSAIGFLEFTLSEWDNLSDQQRRENLERSFLAGVRIIGLFDNILALMSVESGKLVARTAEVPVDVEVARAIDEVAPHVRLEIQHDGAAKARVDRFHLNLVVTNLLTNAERYGQPPFEVAVKTSGDTVEIIVSDHGEGVPREFVPLLFERFTRAETGVAATREGTGFGLYIARELARANGGELFYRPREPKGASFVLTLPRAGNGDSPP